MKVREQLIKVWGEMAHVPEAGGAGQHAGESLRPAISAAVPLGGSECNGDITTVDKSLGLPMSKTHSAVGGF